MSFFEILGWVFLSFLVICHTISFFSNPLKRDEEIYEKTAKDVKFNRRNKK